MRFAVLAAGIAALWAQPAMASLGISISGSGYGYLVRVPEPFKGPHESAFFSDIVFDPAEAVPYANGWLYTHQKSEYGYDLSTLSVFVQNDRLEVKGRYWPSSDRISNYQTYSYSLQFAPGYLSSAFPTRFDPEMFVSGRFTGHEEYGDSGAWYVFDVYGPISSSGIRINSGNSGNSGTLAYFYPIAFAVPEPATWAMMLTGFAVLGAGLRRRKPTVRYSFS